MENEWKKGLWGQIFSDNHWLHLQAPGRTSKHDLWQAVWMTLCCVYGILMMCKFSTSRQKRAVWRIKEGWNVMNNACPIYAEQKKVTYKRIEPATVGSLFSLLLPHTAAFCMLYCGVSGCRKKTQQGHFIISLSVASAESCAWKEKTPLVKVRIMLLLITNFGAVH